MAKTRKTRASKKAELFAKPRKKRADGRLKIAMFLSEETSTALRVAAAAYGVEYGAIAELALREWLDGSYYVDKSKSPVAPQLGVAVGTAAGEKIA